jgi:DNA-directed RNA polymerase specialized sigma24 family protein
VSNILNLKAAGRTWSINTSNLPSGFVDEDENTQFLLASNFLAKQLCLSRNRFTFAELTFLSTVVGVTFSEIADACGLTIKEAKFWEKRFPVSKKHSALMIPFFLKRLSSND